MSSDSNDTRWILGFDGGCITCTDLARRIEGLAAGRLIARNLRETELLDWRRRTLGPDAPLTPTLFALSDDRVRVWRGLGMALRLGRLLGPGRMWQIAQLLGSGVATEEAPSPDRRQFIRTVGGAALGLAVLTGAKALAPLAAAAGEAITITPADRQTSAQMLARARANQRLQRVAERLRADGFAPSGDPSVLIGRQGGAILRTVVVTPYAGRTAGETASLQFSVEPDGREWAQALVTHQGASEENYFLSVNDAGTLETTRVSEIISVALSGCDICKGLCAVGACGIGCGVAAFIVCGPLAAACLGICANLCANTQGVPCTVGCTNLGYCP